MYRPLLTLSNDAGPVIKAPTHQTDNKEQAATKISCCVVFCLLLSALLLASFDVKMRFTCVFTDR